MRGVSEEVYLAPRDLHPDRTTKVYVDVCMLEEPTPNVEYELRCLVGGERVIVSRGMREAHRVGYFEWARLCLIVPRGMRLTCHFELVRFADGSVLCSDVERVFTVPSRVAIYCVTLRFGYEEGVRTASTRFQHRKAPQRGTVQPDQVIDGLLGELVTPGLLLDIDSVLRNHLSSMNAQEDIVFFSTSSYKRMLIHACCEYYGLVHQSVAESSGNLGHVIPGPDGWVPGKAVRVRGSALISSIPSIRQRHSQRQVDVWEAPICPGGLSLEELPSVVLALIVLQCRLRDFGNIALTSKRLASIIREDPTLWHHMGALCGTLERGQIVDALRVRRNAPASIDGQPVCTCNEYVPVHYVIKCVQ